MIEIQLISIREQVIDCIYTKMWRKRVLSKNVNKNGPQNGPFAKYGLKMELLDVSTEHFFTIVHSVSQPALQG